MKNPKISFTAWIFHLLILTLACSPVFAAEIVDQEQLLTEPSRPLAITNIPTSEQKLAQSFTVGVGGFLTQIRIPVSCASGELIVEIQTLNAAGQPSGTVVASARLSHEEVPPPNDFKTFYLSPPLPVAAGDRFAIVLINLTGVCNVHSGPARDTYSGGESFFDARPNPQGWASRPGDLPFQTVVDDGSSGGPGGSTNSCFPAPPGGGPPLPFWGDIPVCRCVRDSVLRNWGCRIIHPDFFIFRRIEFPPNANGQFSESWAFTPLTKLSGPVKMTFKGDGLNGTVVHEFGKNTKIGSFENFNISRKLNWMDGPLAGAATFSYSMNNASSPYQKAFGFDGSVPAKDMKELTVMKKGKSPK